MRKDSIVLFSILSVGGAVGVAGSQGLKGPAVPGNVNSSTFRTSAVNSQAGGGDVKTAVNKKGKGGDKDLTKGKGGDDKGGKGGDDKGKGGNGKGSNGKGKGKGKQVHN